MSASHSSYSLATQKEATMSGFLSVPIRSTKPRDVGITHVIDKGMGIRQLEDLLDTSSDYIDILKLGWGTAYVTQNVFEKIKVCHEAKVPVCFGGTFLELAILQGRFDEYRDTAQKAGLTHVEVSNGVIDMSRHEKAKYIRELTKDFIVLSEVGSKDSEKIIPPYRWVELIESDLEAGAWKVICEARESGTVGLYFGTGEVRSGLVDEITEKIDQADLIFEAPQKTQQVWLVKKLGSEVNIGNVATSDVIALETLRLGLRADTMALFHKVAEWNARAEEHRDPEPARPKRRSPIAD
jgi:phosphosulfolactate synthase